MESPFCMSYFCVVLGNGCVLFKNCKLKPVRKNHDSAHRQAYTYPGL